MNKSLISLAVLAASASIFGQHPGAPTNLPQIGAKAYHDYGPNIRAPYTNTRHQGDSVATATTNYLVYTGPFHPSSLPAPTLAMHGPMNRGRRQNGVGYRPMDVVPAYGFTFGQGGQDAIAIVDAYHSNYTLSDFNTFSTAYGLPTEPSTVETNLGNNVLSIVYTGGVKPPEDSGWAGEMALDVEWAHSFAPNAKLYLVLAQSSSNTDLYAAVQLATQITGVKQVIREVSMSWGTDGEFSGETALDSNFNSAKQGAVYFAATGDSAGDKGYPSMSPYVTAVGGTSIFITNSKFQSETVWNEAGAGPSTMVPIPAFQSANTAIGALIGTFRNTPDIVAIADPNTGVAVYETYSGGWFQVGGTSLATPVSAAIHNRRGQFKVPTGTGLTGTQLEFARQYAFESSLNKPNSANIRDVTAGTIVNSSPATTYTTGPGYDIASGLGEFYGNYAPQLTQVVSGTAIKPADFGTYLSGSLNAPNGTTYNVESGLVSGLGQVAGTEIDFNVKLPAGYSPSTVTLTLGAKAVSESTNQIYFYNWLTKAWDYTEAFPMYGSMVTNTYSLLLSKYVNSSTNEVRIITRAELPTRLGTGTFIYGVGAASVTVGASQASG